MSRSSLLTVVGVAVCAYAATDLIHEVLGHGTAAALSPSVGILSLSTVALQTSGESRWVAAAGTIANFVAAVVAFLVARKMRGFGAGRFFWLLLGATNLFNATAYFIFSAILGIGDWAVVIHGREPAIVWRAAMGLVGLATYAGAISWTARTFTAASVPRRAIVPAYLAGGALMVAGAAMNSISPMLILTSGVSTGFGAMAGLLLVPRRMPSDDSAALPARPAWIIAGAIVGALFVFVVGRGIQIAKVG